MTVSEFMSLIATLITYTDCSSVRTPDRGLPHDVLGLCYVVLTDVVEPSGAGSSLTFSNEFCLPRDLAHGNYVGDSHYARSGLGARTASMNLSEPVSGKAKKSPTDYFICFQRCHAQTVQASGTDSC